MTIPLIEALASGDEAFRSEVRSFYSGKENGGLNAIVEGIARQGGLAGTRKQIAGFVDRAKASLEPIRNGTAKNELEKLADALLVE
jgi:geranylgeranyl pyrophosphate synthase